MNWEALWALAGIASPLIGLGFFTAMVRPYGLCHLSGFKDILTFFFAPWGPKLMLVVKDLAGRIEMYYDRDVTITKSAKGYVIDALGKQYIAHEDPESTADLVSLADARGPIGYPSPFGLAWRALAGWMCGIGLAWVALSATLISDATLPQPKVTPWDWVALIGFIVDMLMVFGVVMQRIYMPQLKLAALIEYGINGPYAAVTKGCSPYDSEPVDKCVARLGGRVVVKVPESVRQYLEALASRIGSHALSAALLSLIDMVPSYRKSLAELRREQRTIKEMARELVSAEFIRYVTKPTLGKVLFWALLFLIGVGVGYAVGSTWSISTHPPPWWGNASVAQAHTHVTATTAVSGHGTASVTPASPPPPVSTSKATITPAPPPTLTTHKPSVTPAPPPTLTPSATVTPA